MTNLHSIIKHLSTLIITLALFSLAAMAQTVTVTSSQLADSTGVLANGALYFRPTDGLGHSIAYRKGGGGLTTNASVLKSVANGAFTITLPDTTLTAPANICFSATLQTRSGAGLGPGYICLQPHYTATGPDDWCQAGVCNLDNYTPNMASIALVQTGPQGPQGQAGVQGPQGPAGLSQVTSSTGTNLTGLLKGNGANVTTATASDIPNLAESQVVSLPSDLAAKQAAASAVSMSGGKVLTNTLGCIDGYDHLPCTVATLGLTTSPPTMPATLYTVPSGAAGEYRMCEYIQVTVAGTSGGVQASGSYTSNGHASGNRSWGLNMNVNTQWNDSNSSGGGNDCATFWADASTPIYAWVGLGGVTGTPSYAFAVSLERLK